MSKLLYLKVFSIALCLLSACNTTSSWQAPVTLTVLNQSTTEITSQSHETSPKVQGSIAPSASAEMYPIEYGNFTTEQLASTIMAELALQNGNNEDALRIYRELALDTKDLNFIQRAMRLATFLRAPQMASEMGKIWLEKDPEAIDAHQLMAIQSVMRARYGEALTHLTYLLENNIEADFRLLAARLQSDDNAELFIEALIADLENISTRFPSAESLQLAIAMLYQQNDQIEEALERLQLYSQTHEDSAELVLQKLDLLQRLDRDDDTLTLLEDATNRFLHNKQIRYNYARTLIANKQLNKALQQFTVLVEQYPRDMELLYSLTLLSLELNLQEDARNYLQRLLINGHRVDDVRYYLAYIAIQNEEDDAAINQLLQVGGGNNFASALRSLSELMLRNDRYRELHSHLQNVRFHNVEMNIELLTMETALLTEFEYYNEAASLLNASIVGFPNEVQLIFQRSILYTELNKLPEMEADLRTVIRLQPDSPVAYNTLGYILADRTERFDEAYNLIRQAYNIAPDDPAIIDSLGWVLFKLGKYSEARTHLERAFKLFPDPEVAAHLGELYWKQGNHRLARRLWRDALVNSPENPHIVKAMQRLNAEK